MAMPVTDENALPLLRAFARLEFRLKNDPGFLRAGPYRMAQVNWPAVDVAVDQIPDQVFLDLISDSTRDKVLNAPRDRPMVQEVEIVNGRRVPSFKFLALQASDAGALLEAARRVRNNLFHGAKEAEHLGDDDAWAIAATEIVTLLLDLLDHQHLHSATP